ncbi:unnamed protein product [Absidia cylindrospora]
MNHIQPRKHQSVLLWLKSHYKFMVIPCCILYLQYIVFHDSSGPFASLPSPSATKNVDPPTVVTTGPPAPSSLPEGVYHNPFPLQTRMNSLPEALVGLWQQGLSMDLIVHVSQKEFFMDYHLPPSCHIRNIVLNHVLAPEAQQLMIPLTKVESNVTLYAHIFLTRTNSPINPGDTRFNPEHIVYKRHVLTKHYLPKNTTSTLFVLKSLYQKLQSTITATSAEFYQEPIPPPPTSLVSYWHEKVTIALVNDGKEAIPTAALQPATLKYISLETTPRKGSAADNERPPLLAGDNGHRIGFYRPIVFPNDFWLLEHNAYPLDENITHLPLTIQVETIAMWKFNTLVAFEDVSKPFGEMTIAEMEQVKRLFLEMNPTWLCILLTLSGLYCLFSFLAFQNDILFWKNKSNCIGVSLSGMKLQLLAHVILLCKAMDVQRATKTSLVMILTHGFSVAIQVWKIDKILPAHQRWASLDRIQEQCRQYGIMRQNPNQSSGVKNTKNESKVSDKEWWRLQISNIVLPIGILILCITYLWNRQSLGLYSLLLQGLSELIYVLDFFFLLPQAIHNHRIKKVDHISRRTLLYKSLNILIDTIFAFIIKTTFIHRLGCFHQDILYLFIFYQSYVFYAP